MNISIIRPGRALALGLAAACGLSLATGAEAHRAWILPAATALSAESPFVTFDAAISNDIFHTDYRAMSTDDIAVIGPDGKAVPLLNTHTGRHRSSFDLQLQQRGTYRVYTASTGLRASWRENGERRVWPPRGARYTPEGFAEAVPTQADELSIVQFSRRIETFVTAGSPSTEVLEASGVGLELVADAHPNDLFEGEAARFVLVIDGEPAVGASVTVIPEGMRYRNAQDAIEVTTDDKGAFEVTWPQAGRYWLEATYADERAKAPATRRSGQYAATFEVLPQ